MEGSLHGVVGEVQSCIVGRSELEMSAERAWSTSEATYDDLSAHLWSVWVFVPVGDWCDKCREDEESGWCSRCGAPCPRREDDLVVSIQVSHSSGTICFFKRMVSGGLVSAILACLACCLELEAGEFASTCQEG